MDPLDLLLPFAFILTKTEDLTKSALNVVQLAVLSFGLAAQVMEMIRTNRDIQELVDFYSAVALSGEARGQDPGEGQARGQGEGRQGGKKDLKALLDDPAFHETFQEYVHRFLRLKEEREKALAIVESLREGTVDIDSWAEIESSVLALVELDKGLLDLLLKQIVTNRDNLRSGADRRTEGTDSVKEHVAGDTQGMGKSFSKSAAFLAGSGMQPSTSTLQGDSVIRTLAAESSGLGMLPSSPTQPAGDPVMRTRGAESFLPGVLEPGLIERAAGELIKAHPNRKQELFSFLEDLTMKSDLWRQLDLYRFWMRVRRRSLCGIGQVERVQDGVESESDGLSRMETETPVKDAGVELERCRDVLISLILQLLEKKEAQLEKLGGEFSGGEQSVLEEVEGELRVVQSEVTRMFEESGRSAPGEEDTARKVVQAAVDLVQKLSGNSKLLNAVKSGRESLLEILIRAKGDRRSLALELATMLGYDQIVRDLVAAGAAVSHRCLNFAVAYGHADALRSLLCSGVSLVNKGERFLSDALKSGKKDVVKVLLEFGAGMENSGTLLKALRHTVQDGNISCVEALRSTGMLEPTVDMLDLVKLAAERGHVGLYRYLIGISFQGLEPVDEGIASVPHRSKLPLSDIIDYRIGTYSSARSDRSLSLDRQFPVTSEMPWLPGYGNVLKMPQEVAKECAGFCERVILDSVDTHKIKEHQFLLSLMKCGSSAEGTKVGLPDEVDFLFLLHTDPISLIIEDVGHGYKKVTVAEAYETILARKLISTGSKMFHDAFVGLVMTQERHRDKIRSAQKIVTVGGSASSEWVLRYDLEDERSLDISVDLVPVVHLYDWPPDALTSTWLMDHHILASEGYALVAKPPSRRSQFGKSLRPAKQQRLWRMSFAHLEAKHLACLEQRIKDVYITCKSLRDPDMCGILFKDSKGMCLSTSKDLITSYMLKMVFMHNVRGFLDERRSLVEMVYIVFHQLAQCISEWCLPFFWQPHVNVLEGLRHEPGLCKQAAKVMQSLAMGLFLRDGESDTAEGELAKNGGVYSYLSTRVSPGPGADSPPNKDYGEHMLSEHLGELNSSEEECVEVVIYSRGARHDSGYTIYQLD